MKNKSLYYHDGKNIVKMGDIIIASHNMGDCIVTKINRLDWEIEVKNRWTGETAHAHPSDCDLVCRKKVVVDTNSLDILG